jgi:hypothetical protein
MDVLRQVVNVFLQLGGKLADFIRFSAKSMVKGVFSTK